ncbi:hypothetical protein LSH36_9g16007 [Paralvinella palmiformis]|uniref:Uncharacterized protein n=1 Tax=Paralvinella palmiformis TaxID=53620 RepID=A0AAD9KDA4_9ANNE|nr:hypothetical protein LSH36_9g16007 [Paralvinella palmiformis]
MSSTTIQRLHSKDDTNKGKARAKIVVYVQSVDYPKSRQITKGNKKSAFIKTMSEFYNLAAGDFNRTSTRAATHLQETYSCDKVKVSMHDMSLTFDMVYNGKQMVSLQCDQSSGQLVKDLERCLLTETLLYQLRVEALYLAAEVHNDDEDVG